MYKTLLKELSRDTLTTWMGGQYGKLCHLGDSSNSMCFVPYKCREDGMKVEIPATDAEGNEVTGRAAYPLRRLVAQGFIEFCARARVDQRSTTKSRFNRYYEWSWEQYERLHQNDPDMWSLSEDDQRRRFNAGHLKQEQERLQASEVLKEYVSQADFLVLWREAREYLKFVQSIYAPSQEELQRQAEEQRRQKEQDMQAELQRLRQVVAQQQGTIDRQNTELTLLKAENAQLKGRVGELQKIVRSGAERKKKGCNTFVYAQHMDTERRNRRIQDFCNALHDEGYVDKSNLELIIKLLSGEEADFTIVWKGHKNELYYLVKVLTDKDAPMVQSDKKWEVTKAHFRMADGTLPDKIEVCKEPANDTCRHIEAIARKLRYTKP